MIVAGFGFRNGTTIESLLEALNITQYQAQVQAIAAPEDKVELQVFQDLALHLDLPIRPCSEVEIQSQTVSTYSFASEKYRNSGSVSEAVALAAAGQYAHLLKPRNVSSDRMATCAIAKGDWV